MIKWNYEKDQWLNQTRGISFQEIADKIIAEDYLDILENPTKPNQDIFILYIHDYTWVVPFVIEKEETIFLKTAFPSRKFHKLYGGKS
jgi:hypothetical protein